MTSSPTHASKHRRNRRTQLIAAAALAAGAAHAAAGGTPVRPASHPLLGASVRVDDGTDWFEAIPGERMTIRVRGSASLGRPSVLESIVSPGTATPLHYHAAEEAFLILSGRLRLVCGGAREDLAAGSSAIVPSGAHHGFVNLSGAPVRLLAIFSPGGIEDLFIQLQSTPPDQWIDLARRFETIIAGPPVTG